MSNYYTAIIRATRASAAAVKRMQRARRDAMDRRGDMVWQAACHARYVAAQRAYERAQGILARHPLSAEGVAARQADAPRARD